jgi:hypothetical protein
MRITLEHQMHAKHLTLGPSCNSLHLLHTHSASAQISFRTRKSWWSFSFLLLLLLLTAAFRLA